MKDVRNIAKKPLRVPLPQGKILHLGLNQEGQVPASALDHPPFQELVEAGELEVLGEGSHDLPHPSKKAGGETSGPARHDVGGVPPSGER
jgi:hypothetical protein